MKNIAQWYFISQGLSPGARYFKLCRLFEHKRINHIIPLIYTIAWHTFVHMLKHVQQQQTSTHISSVHLLADNHLTINATTLFNEVQFRQCEKQTLYMCW